MERSCKSCRKMQVCILYDELQEFVELDIIAVLCYKGKTSYDILKTMAMAIGTHCTEFLQEE